MVFTKHAARNIIGVVGNLISFGLFASPIPTFIRIWKSNSVGEFKSDPYLASIMNCMLWNFYGLPMVHPGSTLLVTINSVGLALELIYITIFFIYAQRNGRLKVTGFLFMEFVVMTALVSFTLKFYDNHEQRSTLVGIFCVVINILMYASPLTIMIASSVGVLSGVLQLILYACYYKAVPTLQVDDHHEKPADLQISVAVVDEEKA
ncbi:bidirectional sugar transporter SWEET5 isoform X2 [Ricinus communis]|uniref:bidirectional sugar transporter SWEET5 isoform X2 n=1 Tax=Ricinus communis TaxID=3988 RepID=UPI00201A6D44|nr:bidirectional sugar transporter SWEET5 isoform X2 [Ricinus communis]